MILASRLAASFDKVVTDSRLAASFDKVVTNSRLAASFDKVVTNSLLAASVARGSGVTGAAGRGGRGDVRAVPPADRVGPAGGDRGDVAMCGVRAGEAWEAEQVEGWE